MKKIFILLLTASLFSVVSAHAQCVQFINYPADTVGWTEGSDHSSSVSANVIAHYINDTFVINTPHGGENNYIYNNFPVTLFGTASEFSASFDFRMDSSGSCSDGLTFWFFTSSLYGLGNVSNEGCSLGFPDTVSGFALAMQTTVCMDDIYLKKLSSTSFNFCGGSGGSPSAGDTDICSRLTGQTFLVDSQWHHCIVNYDHGYITASFDAGNVVMSGYSPIYGTGHFGFMATNGGGYSRKCLKNIQICAGYGTPTVGSDSFGTFVNRLCNGPQIEVHAHTYSAAYHVITTYGDGSYDSSGFAPDAMGGGYVVMAHTYQAAGNYTIRETLYNGTMAIDSLHFSFENVFCATLPVKFYYDVNNDCLPETSDPAIAQPVLAEVDSNGIPVDTISATSGFYYSCQGAVGDIYSFRLLAQPGNMYPSCPATGIVYDTLTKGIFIYPVKYIGMNCGSGSNYDLAVHATIPVTGIHDEWGDVYLSNADCAPANATLTLHYSSKYAGSPSQVNPAGTIAGNTITWNVSSLSAADASPAHLHYQVNYGTTTLTVGDTVHSYFTLDPITGDEDTTNNTEIIIDTVKAGCDPNEMSVLPAGCMAQTSGTTRLEYTINFMNIGNDTAFNIYVMDTLSQYVDPVSLRLEMATNPMNTVIYKAGPYNIVKFDFPAINLQDSAACPQCSGGVIYTINTLPGLPNGTSILNHAGVFFDDNPVVMTNTVENTVGNCDTVLTAQTIHNTAATTIYPNPAHDYLHMSDAGGMHHITISNLLGQVVYSWQGDATDVQADVSGIPAGVYVLQVDGRIVKKLVKQ